MMTSHTLRTIFCECLYGAKMRAIDRDVVSQQLDALLESLTEEGPFSVQSDGKDVVVILSPEDYDALMNGASTSRNAAKRGFPLSRE